MITGICIYNIFTRALTGQLVFIDNTAAVRRRNQICSSFLPMHLCIYAWNGIVLVYCSSSTNRIFFCFPCYGVLLCFTKCLFGLVWTMPCHQSPNTHTHMCACFFFLFRRVKACARIRIPAQNIPEYNHITQTTSTTMTTSTTLTRGLHMMSHNACRLYQRERWMKRISVVCHCAYTHI